MARNPLTYTNRTYSTIFAELEQKYPNRPAWFREKMAGLFDIAHWYLDARAQNTTLSSAFTPQAVRDNAARLDYYPSPKSPASGPLLVTVTASPVTIPKADLVFDITSELGDTLRFEASEDLTILSGTTGTVNVVEGETKSLIDIGDSDGSSEWQQFVMPELDIIFDANFFLTINSLTWERQTATLVNSGPADKHFRTLYLPNGVSVVEFGNGVMGAIPGPYTIFASYRIGGGVAGNVAQTGSVVSYVGTNVNVVSAVLDADFTGGAEKELVETTRFLAPRMLRANYRAVTEEDFETLSRAFSSSVIIAKAIPGLYGAGTTAVHVVPANGGAPSTSLKTSLEAYLKDATSLGSADVRVRDPLYQTEDVTAAIKMRSGYTFAANLPYATLTVRLIISETAKEIVDIYNDPERGIAGVVEFVNTKWGYSFTSTDYNEITRIISRRSKDGTVTWGGSLRINDIISALDDLTGVETETVSVPATDINVPFNRILTDGTVTITEIV